MSTDTPEQTNVFGRLRPPAVLNYVVLTAAGLLVYFLMMLAKGNDAGALIAILVAVAGVLARWVVAPALVLILTTYLQVDRGFFNLIGQFSGGRWFLPDERAAFQIEDVILAAALLAYVIGHFRLTTIVHQGMPNEPTPRREGDPKTPPRRPAELVADDEFPRTMIIGGGCVIVAEIVWVILMGLENLGRPNAFSPATTRFLIVAWLAGLALMLVSAALVYMRSARMTRSEASLVLRDEFFHENRRETDRLQRWRKWFKERVAARRRAGK
jgi:hypothetical protein